MRAKGLRLSGTVAALCMAGWASLLVTGGWTSAFGQQGLLIVQKDGTFVVRSANRTLLEYQAVASPFKPYLKQLMTPSGIGVLRDSPADHKHHHALMFAVAVDGVNFWAEQDTCGRQVSRSAGGAIVGAGGGQARAVLKQAIDWMDARGERTMMQEERIIEFHQLPEIPATLLTWRSRLTAPQGKEAITLTGSPYFGLGMRFVASMDTGGQFQNAEGKTGVSGTNAVRSAWCAYSASAEGKPVTAAIFDHPSNPRHPATWFTMERFAYLSATLGLNKEPLKIPSGKPLVLRYGVALWDGKPQKEQIHQVYQVWVKLSSGE